MNKELFIVGKGPSLKGFDYNKLKDRYTMGINSAIHMIPNPDILIFVDKNFYLQNKEYTDNFKGEVLAAKGSRYPNHIPDTTERDYTRLTGILAIYFGLQRAEKIYLLGYDMNTTDEYPYAEEDYGLKDKEHFEKMDGSYRLFYGEGWWINQRLGIFDSKFSEYKDRIFNCNPNSAIKTFDYINIEDVL